MKKILKFLNDYLEETICIILMSVMTIIIFIQVIMRYVMHNSLSWSEELARYCFIWLIYIGVAYGCKLMKHIKIDAALKLFPEKVRPYITIVGELLVLAFAKIRFTLSCVLYLLPTFVIPTPATSASTINTAVTDFVLLDICHSLLIHFHSQLQS